MPKKIVNIKGMHCKSCEILIEEKLKEVKGINKVKVSEKTGTAQIYCSESVTDKDINDAVTNAGYSVGTGKLPLISKNPQDYKEAFLAGIILIILLFVIKASNILNVASVKSSNLASLPVVFLIGLTAGVSTCVALVGGIIFAVSTRFSEQNPNLSSSQKFKPHIFFNFGRILFFALFGGIIGYLGSLIHLSTGLIGVLTALVGLVTLLLGLQITGLFPIMEKIKITLPKNGYGLIKSGQQQSYSHKMVLLLGGLTFFLPCGFTQAMQLYAIGTRSPISGALTMGVFALGTTPGLLGVGGISSVMKGAKNKLFFKLAGLIVIALAVFNITNALNLAGINVVAAKKTQGTVASLNDQKVQLISMTQNYSGYSPNYFTIKKDVPVQWVINADGSGCSSSLVSSQLNLRRTLQVGENLIEFTPTKEGVIRFSCAMGMYTGSFNVVK